MLLNEAEQFRCTVIGLLELFQRVLCKVEQDVTELHSP
ncbi:hypothetical protein MUK42_35140 [Musa troglodytarum]|uniref:Uncharacterized protein n=1 Tax=Musa troglodytarum TaxID=320322 RepID=A0A9E7H4T6_9LILI|nr:hypothetical protein MUK42_35140 [Musa troglodytarum]